MKPRPRLFPLVPALAFSLLVFAVPAGAAPVFVTAIGGPNDPSTSTDELVFAADVSGGDLLHGIVGTGGTWLGNGSSPAGLNDGAPGGDYEASGLPAALGGAAWASDGNKISFREFVLGTGSNGIGYDITGIRSIAAWSGAGFSNQKYEVRVRRAGEAGFPVDPLLTVDYQPFGTALTQGGSTKVNVTDDSGLLAGGVVAIRFDILDTNSNNAGGAVLREIDVFGSATVAGIDETPPAISSLSPVDGATGVSPSASLVATFSETISLGTGNIRIRDLDAPAQTEITLPDPRVAVSGAVLTINPGTDLAAGTRHAVEIDATAIDDLAGNSFIGISGDTTWDFTTGVPDLAAPALVTFSPADNAPNVPLASNLVATFDEAVALGSGTIAVRNLDTPANTVTLTLPDARVSVSGPVLTINLTANLSPTADYAVRISSGAVTDLSGNPFIGIADDTTWNFVTASAPLRIMCLGDSITVGYTDNPSWANHPFMFGYRSGLYTRLTNAGYNFQFVGASTEPWTGISGDPTMGGTYTPALDLRDFGQDKHRGYGGASIWSNVNAWIDADDPDVILLLIGINGIGSGSPAALNTLVGSIVTKAPDVPLIVAQITPRSTFNQSLYNYNVYIRDTLVPTYAGNGHKVTTVDLYSLFLTDPNNYASAIQAGVLSNNINHPDNPHYDLMAQEWFEGIEALGLGPDTFDHWISDPTLGIDPAKRGLDDDADNDGIDNGVENYFGTHPGAFSRGLVAGSKGGNTFTFTHPAGGTLASDLDASYRWSKDLATFTPDGGAFGGSTVTFTPGTPSGGFVTVTATVAGTPLGRLFVEVEVTRK